MQHFVNISTRKSKTKQNKKKKNSQHYPTSMKITRSSRKMARERMQKQEKNESLLFNLFIKQVAA
jgi:hypothetical protein